MRRHLFNSKSLIIVLTAFNLFPYRVESYPLSEKAAFCRGYADENTGLLFNNYQYERTKNYNYCMRNSQSLIYQYENPIKSFKDNIKNLKYETFDRKREEKLKKQRAKFIKEREEAKRNARKKYLTNISDNLENIFD